MKQESEPSSDRQLIFQAISIDGSLMMSIFRDDEPISDFMREIGCMGTLVISSTRSTAEFHKERIALSPSSIFGPGPSEEEFERWAGIFSEFLEE